MGLCFCNLGISFVINNRKFNCKRFKLLSWVVFFLYDKKFEVGSLGWYSCFVRLLIFLYFLVLLFLVCGFEFFVCKIVFR